MKDPKAKPGKGMDGDVDLFLGQCHETRQKNLGLMLQVYYIRNIFLQGWRRTSVNMKIFEHSIMDAGIFSTDFLRNGWNTSPNLIFWNFILENNSGAPFGWIVGPWPRSSSRGATITARVYTVLSFIGKSFGFFLYPHLGIESKTNAYRRHLL